MEKNKETLEVVRIFIASPGDVRKERTLFRDVIEELNEIKAAKAGKRLVPVGWEDTLPGRGRPQELINEDLITCDLVVGLLWRRWGSTTKKYSSGFEEEYELAREHDIDMWLYFRDVEEAMMADPGPQLRQVLDFRDRIERERAMLYHSYADEQDWEKTLRRHISLWLDKLPQDRPPEIDAGDLQARIAELEQALARVKSEKTQMALDLVKDAWDCAEKGQLTKAEEFFARAVNDAPEPSVRLEYARFLVRIGHLDRVEETLDELLDFAREVEDRVLEADVRNDLGILHRVRGDLDKAKEMHQNSLEINKALDREEGIAVASGNLGVVYETRGDLDKAEEMYHRVLEIESMLGGKKNMANAYGNLGIVYRKGGNLDQAEEMNRKSLEIDEVLGNKEGIASNYSNLGSVYGLRSDLDQAEEMYRKSLEINKELGRKKGVVIAYGNLGNVYRARGDLDKAEEMFNKTLKINEVLGWKEGMAGTYANQGLVYEARGDLDKAEEMYRKSLVLFKVLGTKTEIEQMKALIHQIEEKRRDA